MSTQVQIRGASTATQEARTLASRELDVDTTLGRLNVHNGVDAGGVPHARWLDSLNQTYCFGSVSGTNAIAITLTKPPPAYVTGMKVGFIAAATCTGSVTINVNALGAVTCKKISGSGLVGIASGDILANGYYEAVYNGTYFIVISGIAGVQVGGELGAATATTPAATDNSTKVATTAWCNDRGYSNIGSYCFAGRKSGGAALASGNTIAGSSLYPAAIVRTSLSGSYYVGLSSTNLTGTWRCLGYIPGSSYDDATLFQRIA